jgi:hypothetical protein
VTESSSTIVRFGGWFFSILFVISAPVGGYFLFQIYLMAKASEAWPSVPGLITKAKVAQTSVGRYYADVTYNYTVRGQKLRGTRVRASDGEYDFRDGAVQAIKGLASGQTVEVYFDPAAPTQSVLQPGVGFQERALLCVPVVMLSIGIAGIVWLLLSRKNLTRLDANEALQI